MTDREKAIVMAYTGICTLTGDRFQIFHKYVEDIMGRPIWTHEMGLLADEIKEKSEVDFMALCADESSSEKPNKWIPVTERLPEKGKDVLVWYEYFRYGNYNRMYQTYGIGYQYNGFWGGDVSGTNARCIAWMPLPEPYKAEGSDKE